MAADHEDGSNPENDTFQYIFGFGSIMNTTTHAPWLQSSSSSKTEVSLPGAVVTLKRSFGYERQWNFRSSTGFTALGVSPCQIPQGNDMIGVLFRIPSDMIPGFDRRELGYQKVAIPLDQLVFHYDLDTESSTSSLSLNAQTKFHLTDKDRIWIYVPLPSHATNADENHPLLQSYVDTVLQGCLEWGGEAMAEQFLQSTGGWSPYFLNDTPSSRRPWLFRKEYNTIDALLKKYSERTHYGDRRHPEEFASAFHRRMKGTWSIPRRNPNFTGRDAELEQLRRRLSTQDGGRQKAVATTEVAGMGGVGKSQLVTEYCYREFPSQYGLVAWFNAESIDSLVSDYRQLLADMAAEGDSSTTPSEDTDEIIGEVKTRLFRSQVPWLLVFDNLEDRKLLSRFVPRGAGMKGHVLVTTRLVDTQELDNDDQGPIILGCFSPEESLELLRRAAGSQNVQGEAGLAAARQICQRLGHLPLALGMAAAYMRRCDVNCAEYLDRYVASEKAGQSLLRHGKLNDYSLSVISSLSLSLGAIERENATAGDVLRLLCYLGPDQITKQLLRHLLASKNKAEEEPFIEPKAPPMDIVACLRFVGGVSGVLGCFMIFAAKRRHPMGLALLGAGAVSIMLTTTTFQLSDSALAELSDMDSGMRRSSSIINSSFSAFEYEQADLVWDILKSFSLLTVKDGKGIIHRLLSQAMRASQSEEVARRNLLVCVNTMYTIWGFQADRPETWKDAIGVLEHVKHLVSYVADSGLLIGPKYTLRVAQLSIEAGVLSAMAINAFVEAQGSLELASRLLQGSSVSHTIPFRRAQAHAHYELGKVYRYHGEYDASERSLMAALDIYTALGLKDDESVRGAAYTLHELGVLESKKHNLDGAARFLQKALDMRRAPGQASSNDSSSDCAATLHQLASVYVARKPPALTKAKKLLQEALSLSRQIGQRAATLKQLARVTIRQGDLPMAETYLNQALELYVELYGESKMHINIAAVKFQQGALAMQRGQYDDALSHYTECLRVRRHVYSYARPVGSSAKDADPSHLEVSCVLHELGRVAFAQKRYPQAIEFMESERTILERLVETTSQAERLFQARLTNLTWLRKCAKTLGDEDVAAHLAADKAVLRRNWNEQKNAAMSSDSNTMASPLLQKAIECRLVARQLALDSSNVRETGLDRIISDLQVELSRSPGNSQMVKAIADFCLALAQWIEMPKEARKVPILSACDRLRYDLFSLRCNIRYA